MKNRLFTAALIASLWAATCMAQKDVPHGQTTPAPSPQAKATPADAGKPDEEITERRITVEFVDGSLLVGTVPADLTFPVQADELKADIAIKWVSSVTMSADHKTAVIEMLNGDRVNGALSAKALPLQTAVGKLEPDWRFIKIVKVLDIEASAKGLVFWNALSGEEDLRRSAVGPALAPYARRTDNSQDVIGSREFIKGEHGGAITVSGAYQQHNMVHDLELRGLDKLINPEQGCIEFWYCQLGRPVADQYGVYRMFDGQSGLGSRAVFFASPDGIKFALNCNSKESALNDLPTAVNVAMQDVPDKQWIHLAAVWNRKGIEGTKDAIRLYLDGKQVAACSETGWGATVDGVADICGGNDNCARKFMMNNLKIWNYSKTDFDTGKAPDVDPKNLQPPVTYWPQSRGGFFGP